MLGSCQHHPNVPLFMACWSLLVGIGLILKGSCGCWATLLKETKASIFKDSKDHLKIRILHTMVSGIPVVLGLSTRI